MWRPAGTAGTHQTSHSVMEIQRMFRERSRSQMLWGLLFSDLVSFCGAAEREEQQPFKEKSRQSRNNIVRGMSDHLLTEHTRSHMLCANKSVSQCCNGLSFIMLPCATCYLQSNQEFSLDCCQKQN